MFPMSTMKTSTANITKMAQIKIQSINIGFMLVSIILLVDLCNAAVSNGVSSMDPLKLRVNS